MLYTTCYPILLVMTDTQVWINIWLYVDHFLIISTGTVFRSDACREQQEDCERDEEQLS